MIFPKKYFQSSFPPALGLNVPPRFTRSYQQLERQRLRPKPGGSSLVSPSRLRCKTEPPRSFQEAGGWESLLPGKPSRTISWIVWRWIKAIHLNLLSIASLSFGCKVGTQVTQTSWGQTQEWPWPVFPSLWLDSTTTRSCPKIVWHVAHWHLVPHKHTCQIRVRKHFKESWSCNAPSHQTWS